MSPKEKAEEILEKFDLPTGLMSIEIKQCALICIENEYHSNRELLIHLKGSGVIENERVYLALLQKLIDEEKEVKQEIEKL